MTLKRRTWAAAVAAVLGVTGGVRADTLWVGSGSGAGLELKDVRVLRIEGGRVVFRTGGGGGAGESSRDVGQVLRMALDDEPGLTSAETAFVGGQFDKATDEYLRVSRSTSKAWLKQWVGLRLMKAATKANRFEAAVAAYVELVGTDARLAQEYRPALVEGSLPKAGVLEAAGGELEKALERGTKLSGEQRQALQQLLLEIYRARGEQGKAGKLLEQMAGGAGTGTSGDAVAKKALADLRLGAARVALDGKDFAKAAAAIEENRGVFTEPRQQAEALWVLAAAREGEARAEKDTIKLKDAALAYMRVVANFRGIAGAELRLGASLLKTGEILEELGEKAEARAVYRELAEGSEAGVKEAARRGLERLK